MASPLTGQLQSLFLSQSTKRDAVNTVDSVSAEEAGKFPDQNVADALQRVPGVSVNRSGGESNQITVRGFGPNFVNVLLNGRTMATAATDRAFDFDVLAVRGDPAGGRAENQHARPGGRRHRRYGQRR